MIDFPPNGDGHTLPDLPVPDVEFIPSGTPSSEFTEAGIKGMFMNPVYAGVAQFPALVNDKQWVAECRKILEQDGPEQFLVNMLFLLRETLGHTVEQTE